jgi:hypothetical protein
MDVFWENSWFFWRQIGHCSDRLGPDSGIYIQSTAHDRGKGLPLFMMVFVSKLVGNYITPAYGAGIKHVTLCLVLRCLPFYSLLLWVGFWTVGGGGLRAVVFAHLGHLLRAAADKHLRMLIVGEQPRISNSFKTSFTFPMRPCSL